MKRTESRSNYSIGFIYNRYDALARTEHKGTNPLILHDTRVIDNFSHK